MKLCSDCAAPAWPYAMVTVIAAVVAFITWLVLGLSELEPTVRLGGAGGIFIAVEGTLLHYVYHCMRRHCRHDQVLQTLRSPAR